MILRRYCEGCMMELQEIEQCAMHNEPLPEDVGQPEQYAYLCLRRLYQDYYSKRIPKEQAQREKKQYCRSYREAQNREQQRLEAMRGQLEAVKASGGILTQIIQTADTADLSSLLLSSIKCLCLLRGEMVSYGLIEQKINERRQSDAQNTQEQTAGAGN